MSDFLDSDEYWDAWWEGEIVAPGTTINGQLITTDEADFFVDKERVLDKDAMLRCEHGLNICPECDPYVWSRREA